MLLEGNSVGVVSSPWLARYSMTSPHIHIESGYEASISLFTSLLSVGTDFIQI